MSRFAAKVAAACSLLAAGLVLGGPALAAQLVPAESRIGFVSRQMGVPVEGSFRRFDADIDFDPAKPGKGHFAIRVDTSSVDLPTRDAIEEVAKPGWFDAARFPRATFESTAVRAAGTDRYEVDGTLTVRGQARPVVVPVQLTRSPGRAVAEGEFTVRRLAFSIGAGEWADTSLVADEVLVRFRLVLSGKPF